MDTEQTLFHWIIIRDFGRQIGMPQCLAGQDLVDTEQEFRHAEHCQNHHPESEFPWIALHEILDRSRDRIKKGRRWSYVRAWHYAR